MSTVTPSTAEFDAFGPWIDEVRTAEDVPPLYRAHHIDFETARMVLKFPRDISRRDATPQMDLYDHLLIAETDRLTVLSRTATRYSQTSVDYGDIAVMTEWANLLDAELRIDTVLGETVVVAFNGTSRDRIVELVDLLRGLGLVTRAAKETRLPPIAGALELDDLGKKDSLFVTSFRDRQRREPGIALLAAHGRVTVTRRGGFLSRIADLVFPVTLHGALVCASPTELQILSRRHWLVRGGTPELSSARTVLPLDLLHSVRSEEHPRYAGASTVTLRVGGAMLAVVMPTGSPAEKTLRALGSR
ncbi:hypothetical protein HD599_001531 [Conyzicola lurida]|uniref:Uncharacterized protein n=1 Tax=Conyzicola lurida TaxID=1172621 RepID=A0A841ALI0_9MICO|nr:hypothetical protein [Conyzicola lurida]MBB5843208.1 hypothetical protein [Conyzicola lurida]